MLNGVEVIVEVHDARLDVSLQLTTTKVGETHQLQVPDDSVARHLSAHAHRHARTDYRTKNRTTERTWKLQQITNAKKVNIARF